jgi:peptidoglycan hydrolase-like protein with peptidoglycan-binding domain
LNNPQVWGIAVNNKVKSVYQNAGYSLVANAKLSLNAGDIVSIRNVYTTTGIPTLGGPATLRLNCNAAWVQIDKAASTSDNNGGSSPSIVPVSAITVTSAGDTTTVHNGATLQMSAAAEPADATNKTLSWYVISLDGGKANITPSGLLTATAVGTVRVTAINVASVVTGTKDITVLTPDKSALTAAINAEYSDGAARTQLLLTSTDYTSTTWNAYTDAITAAKAVEIDATKNQPQIDSAKNKIATQKGKLVALVDAATPVITADLQNISTFKNTPVMLDASATVTDGGTVSYTWFKDADGISGDGIALDPAVTTATYSPSVTTVGDSYYYCVVTNTNTGVTRNQTATKTSAIAKVTVKEAAYPGSIIRSGVIGQIVITVQDRLKALGFNCGATDGIFGSLTRSAVIRYQAANGLVPDGIVGPLTWGKIFGFNPGPYTKQVSYGSSAYALVGTIQDKLISLGFNPGPLDGKFGPRTLTSVKTFQQSRGLVVDGIVGSKTWHALFGD